MLLWILYKSYGQYACKFTFNSSFHMIWHQQLGHPGQSMFQSIMKNTYGISLHVHLVSSKVPYIACSKGKLIIQPSHSKIPFWIPSFLERIQVDTYGPINPPSGLFCYYMVVIDASTKWTNIMEPCYSQNFGLASQIESSNSQNSIWILQINNANEFTSKLSNDFCISLGIDVEYPVPHVHFQNNLAQVVIR